MSSEASLRPVLAEWMPARKYSLSSLFSVSLRLCRTPSGLSFLLALAEAFAEAFAQEKPLQRGLVFLASSGHFHGAVGCREFVGNHRGGLLEKIVAAIGVEHIAEEV